MTMIRESGLNRKRVGKPVFGVDPIQYNKLIEAAQLAQRSAPAGVVEESDAEPWATAHNVLAQLGTGETLDRGKVVGIAAPYTLAAGADRDTLFHEGPNFLTEEPAQDKHWGKAATLWTPGNPNQISEAHLAGVSVADVLVDSFNHDHCDVQDGPYELRTHWSGSWQILWADPSITPPAVAQCLVIKKGPWQRVMKATATETIAWNGSGDVDVSVNGVNVDTVTAHHNWVSKTAQQSISTGDQILVQWFWDELKWVVVEIETTGGGTAAPQPGASFKIIQNNLPNTGGIEFFQPLPLQAGNIVDPTGDITLDGNNQVQVGSEGVYRYSYNLEIDPPDLTYYVGVDDALQVAYDTFRAGVTGGIVSERQLIQTYRAAYVTPAADPHQAGTVTFESIGMNGSISASGLFDTDPGGGVFIMQYAAATTGNNVTGSVHVNRVRTL